MTMDVIDTTNVLASSGDAPKRWSNLHQEVLALIAEQEQNAVDLITGPEVSDADYDQTLADIQHQFDEVRRRWLRRAHCVMRGAEKRSQFSWHSACEDVLEKADEASHYIVRQYYGFLGEVDFD